jgi:hypothetical protein
MKDLNWKRIAKVAGASCAIWVGVTLALVTLPGCEAKIDPSVIRTSLQMTAKYGTAFGLKKWGEKEPAAAKEAATALTANITGVLIPYLDGGKLPSSAEVQAMINSSLFKNVNPAIKDAILACSVALDAVLPIPSADTYLDANQVSYVKAFMTGIKQGCDGYIGNAEGKAQAEKPPVWIK